MDHSFLPPVPSAANYTRGFPASNTGGSVGIGATDDDTVPAGEGSSMAKRWLLLSGLNFAVLWLFIKEFGLAAVLALILGVVEANID